MDQFELVQYDTASSLLNVEKQHKISYIHHTDVTFNRTCIEIHYHNVDRIVECIYMKVMTTLSGVLIYANIFMKNYN